MRTKLAVYDTDDYDAMLHAEDDRGLVVVAERMYALMEQEFRDRNPGKPVDALMCGGCVRVILKNLIGIVAESSVSTPEEVARFYQYLGTPPHSLEAFINMMVARAARRSATGVSA